MRFLKLIAFSSILMLGLSSCSASPELQKLCKQYVDQQMRAGKAKSRESALQSCLRLDEDQVRCLQKARGRNAKIACTQ